MGSQECQQRELHWIAMALYGGQPSDLPFHLLIDNTNEDHLVSGVRCCVIGTGDIDGAHHDPSDLLIYR